MLFPSLPLKYHLHKYNFLSFVALERSILNNTWQLEKLYFFTLKDLIKINKIKWFVICGV